MIRSLLLFTAAHLMFGAVARAQTFVPTEFETNAALARAIVDRALVAHRARELDTTAVFAEWSGVHTSVLQNLDPDFTRNPLPRSIRVARAAGGRRAFFEDQIARPGVYTGWHRYIVDGDRGTDLNLNSNQHRPTSPRGVERRVRDMLPSVLLVEASRGAISLLPAPADLAHDGVLAILPDGSRLALYFERSSGLLARTQSPVTLLLVGERSWDVRFSDYRTVSGIPIPWVKRTALSGAFAESLAVASVRFGPTANSAETFALPVGAQAVDNSATRRATPARVVWLSTRVLQITGIGGGDATVLAAAVADTVVVLGAPGGISDSVMKVVAEKFPAKQLRYVVPTHHHIDHAGGLGAFLERGVTVVSTPGNQRWIQALGGSGLVSPTLVLRDKVLTLGSGAERVELYDIGPTPHATEMVIAYIPSLQLVYQGDLLEVDDDDPITAQTANEVTPSLLTAIERLKLPVRLIVGTEGRAATLDDLRLAVSLRNRGGNPRD